MATHVPPPVGEISAISHFAAAAREPQPGRQLDLIRKAAPEFRAWFRTTGMPEWIGTFDLVSLPYPTRFGLFRAAISPAPYLSLTHRLVVVRWREPDGKSRVLLFEPTDVELARRTPYFARLSESTPPAFERAFARPLGDVVSHLRSVGIDTGDVDWITFDHLHTQDVRRWIGTTEPAQDLSTAAPLAPVLPRARLIVQRAELDSLAALHPLQLPWYQAWTYTSLRPDALLPIDGDVLIGPGVALLSTPGHTIGNQTLVVNTETGIWASSENVIATECLTPEHSRIPGDAPLRTRVGAGGRAQRQHTRGHGAAVQLVRPREVDRRCRACRLSLSAVHALVGAHRHHAQPGDVADVHALRDFSRHVDPAGAVRR